MKQRDWLLQTTTLWKVQLSSGIPELQSPRVIVGNSQFQSFNYYNHCFFLCDISRRGRKSRRGQSEMPAILVSHKAAVGCQKNFHHSAMSIIVQYTLYMIPLCCVCLSLSGVSALFTIQVLDPLSILTHYASPICAIPIPNRLSSDHLGYFGEFWAWKSRLHGKSWSHLSLTRALTDLLENVVIFSHWHGDATDLLDVQIVSVRSFYILDRK